MISEQELRVSKIREGTVIDHIPAGRALSVLRLIGITGREGYVVTVAMNVRSGKLGRKDLVKVENLMMKPEQVDKLTLIAPTATVNIIKDYSVVEKRRVSIPDRIVGIVRCINPNCVTRKENEPVKSSFTVVDKSPLRLRCDYCGRYVTELDIITQLTS